MNEDFLELLSALNDAEARFLVVGAYAVGVCHVIALPDLLANKRAAARPQDLADVDGLERLAHARAERR